MDSNNNSRKQFVENLEYFMKRDHKKQIDISKALGLNANVVHDWVSGKKYPRIENMKKIADYFNISISELVDKEKDNFYSLPFYSSTMEVNDSSNTYRLSYQDAFLFCIEDNHMQPKFEKGDIVVGEKKTIYIKDCFVIAKRKSLLSVYWYNHNDKTIETIKPKNVYTIDKDVTLIAKVIELRRKL